MRDLSRRAILCVIIGIATATSGCGGGAPLRGFAVAGNASPASVGEAERNVVQSAAREMTGADDARVHGLSAKISSGEEGLDICGYVNTPSDDGLPLYVELREADGVVTAQRGQIGATPAKLAKVRFMCRKH